jgi:sensor domain CHASE-containing protein
VEVPPSFVGSEPEVVFNSYSIDNTSRTHVAVRDGSGHARLIIYDGTRWPAQKIAVNAVYAWNGNRLSEIAPAEADKEILAAMAARDDAGTFPQWVIYYLLAWPGRLVYVSIFVAAALVYRKQRRAERITPIGG